MLLTTAIILVTPGFTEGRTVDRGVGIRRPDPIASPNLPPAITGPSIATASSVGMRLVPTAGPGRSQGPQLSQGSQESQGPHGSRGFRGTQGSQGSRRSQGSQGLQNSEEAKRFQRSKGSTGLRGSQGSQESRVSEGEAKTVPSSTTGIHATTTTTEASTTETAVPPGSTTSSTGTDRIDDAINTHGTSKTPGSSTGCIGHYIPPGDQNDKCKGDGPEGEHEHGPELGCDSRGNSAQYSEHLR